MNHEDSFMKVELQLFYQRYLKNATRFYPHVDLKLHWGTNLPHFKKRKLDLCTSIVVLYKADDT